MTRPRSQLISLDATPYYHCIARCVRRAFLCGEDKYTGKNFDHRKKWLVERLALLAEVFAIDIAAYAIMSNHIHLVLHINQSLAMSWSDDEVVGRWLRIYKGHMLIQRYAAGDLLMEAEQQQLKTIISQYRNKLFSISRFMSCLNEFIARKANIEDKCTGRFWEGRFKSQALLDESALISCMAYVDLNPVRAGIANSIADSDFTSIQNRLCQVKKDRTSCKNKEPGSQSNPGSPRLMPFSERLKQDQKFSAIPYNLRDYLDLADWTGRIVRADKRGAIVNSKPKLLDTLNISPCQWQVLALQVQKESITMLHGMEVLCKIEKQLEKQEAA